MSKFKLKCEAQFRVSFQLFGSCIATVLCMYSSAYTVHYICSAVSRFCTRLLVAELTVEEIIKM